MLYLAFPLPSAHLPDWLVHWRILRCIVFTAIGNRPRPINLLPVSFPFLVQAQKIICCNIVILTELDQMVDGQFVRAALIPCVHSLGGSEHIRNLLLGFIGIFPQITHDFDVFDACSLPTQNPVSMCCYYICWEENALDNSKYLYYNICEGCYIQIPGRNLNKASTE